LKRFSSEWWTTPKTVRFLGADWGAEPVVLLGAAILFVILVTVT
jgi:hypothetical protein